MTRLTLSTAAAVLAAALPIASLAAPGGLVAQGAPCNGAVRPFMGGAFDGAGPDHERLRILQVAGRIPLRSALEHRASDWLVHDPCPAPDLAADPAADADPVYRPHSELVAAPIGLISRYNSTYPTRGNDGAMWAGVGLSGGVTAGAAARVGAVTGVFRPEGYYMRNANFPAPDLNSPTFSRFADLHYGGRIDLPHRFGDEPIYQIEPGQSALRVDRYGVVAGVATENVRWGPSISFPLILSNAAPGFPHVFLGTSSPARLPWVDLEVRTMVAWLHESDFYDRNSANNVRYMSGFVLAIHPRALPGLTLGATRAFTIYSRGDTVGIPDLLRAAFTNLTENPRTGDPLVDNQLASLFAHLAFPDAGLEAWAEYGRNDHWRDMVVLFMQPQMARAYNWGVQAVLGSEDPLWRVLVEGVNLTDPLPTNYSHRGFVPWYTHSQIRHGHTHRGQLLGAPVGPGGSSQMLSVDRIGDLSWLGGQVVRTIYNMDQYHAAWWRYFDNWGYDAELTFRLRGATAVRGVGVTGSLGYSRRWNREFMRFGSQVGLPSWDWDLPRESNFSGELRLTWRPEL